MTPSIEKLVNCFASLPGIGRKSASRLAYRIIAMTDDEVRAFSDAILEAKGNVKLCDVCMAYCEDGNCNTCSNPSRSNETIIVVEDNKALEAIEDTHEFNGKYHVLHGVISPVDGVGPDQLKVKELLVRINDNVKEVIIATNPTPGGDTTAAYLARILEPYEVEVSRLAYGIPVGGDIEYADEVTLYRAMEGRRYFK